jgi:VWFA-related protein
VEYFTVIRNERSEDLRAQGVPSPKPGHQAEVAPNTPAGTSYLVFIDSCLNLARDRNQVLEGLLADLPLLEPQDRMAVVNYDGRRVDVLSGWTQSRPAMRQALQRAMGTFARGHGATNQYAGMFLEGFVDATASVPAPPIDEGLTDGGVGHRKAVRDYEHWLEKVVTAATASLRGFAHTPGRKVLILLAGKWPASVSSYLFSGPVVIGDEGMKLYRPLHDTANLLGYTIYPVHVPLPGIGTSQMGKEAELRWTGHEIAAETGGLPLRRKDRRAALARITEDIRSYYSLGFTPTWHGDEARHRVVVRVLRPGLRVRSREHFQDLSLQQSVSFMVEGALLLGEMPNAQPLEVRLGAAQKSGWRRITLPLEISIPLDAVTMLPQGEEYFANLELRVAVLDQGGDRNEMPVIPVKLQGPEPQPGQRALYNTEVKLRKESHRVVVSVHDPTSGTILLTTESISVPPSR